jgi:hypothetical protein
MRFGLIGPAHENLSELGQALRYLATSMSPQSCFYLGMDGTDLLAEAELSARAMCNEDTAEAIWQRASDLALYGTVDALDSFVSTARELLWIRSLRRLSKDDSNRIVLVPPEFLSVSFAPPNRADLERSDCHMHIFASGPAPVLQTFGKTVVLGIGPLTNDGGIGILELGQQVGTVRVLGLSGKVTLEHQIVSPSMTIGVQRAGTP